MKSSATVANTAPSASSYQQHLRELTASLNK